MRLPLQNCPSLASNEAQARKYTKQSSLADHFFKFVVSMFAIESKGGHKI